MAAPYVQTGKDGLGSRTVHCTVLSIRSERARERKQKQRQE